MGLDLAIARPTNFQAPQIRAYGHPHSVRSIGRRSTRLHRREVPLEHSHEIFVKLVNEFLKKDNPDNIQDAVFGLLGNAAASAGQGKITDTDCLQQATADRAFTNAKKENDLDGQIGSLIYRALERNTGSVGQKSTLCTSIKAVNPEIALISQHQDPASDGAAATNKAIALELAVQIALVGGDPLDALDSGTFAPGNLGDPTGAGNTCDDLDDPADGCIFTKFLIVEDATEDEVKTFVASRIGNGGNGGNGGNNGGNNNGGAATTTTTAAGGAASTTLATVTTSAATTTSAAATATATGGNGNGGKLNLGSCKNAKVIFAANLDGRREAFAFAPASRNDFPHGADETLKTITDFICKFYHLPFPCLI